MTLKYENLISVPWGGLGQRDCYSLIMDFYEQNFGIKLTNYARPNDWSSDELDLIRDLYEREGFEMITEWRIKDLRPADILAMSIGEANPNHLAIFLDNDEIIHHLYGKMSRTEPFRGFWRNHISFVLRHPDVPDLRPVRPDAKLMDILRARNAAPTERSE